MTSLRLTLLALAVGTASRTLVAQTTPARRPIEIGMDGALFYESSDNDKATVLSFPLTRVRAGFFVGDAISVEPSVAFTYAHAKTTNPFTGEERTSSGTSYDLGVGFLFHLSADRARTQTFVRPFVGLRGVSGDGPSASQPTFGGSLGIKTPLATQLAARFELGYQHRNEDAPVFASSNQAFLSFGLSFFTH